MPATQDAWGIEVGANAIKALHLAADAAAPSGVRLLEYDIIPFKKILTTPDLNVDEAVQMGLDQLLSKYEMAKSQVVVSVAGHLAFARFAKLPPVEPKKIPQIVKFEAAQQVPFPLEQVEWDYQVFAKPDSPDVAAGIFAITKERVASLLANYQAVGIPVHGLTLSPVAVYNAMAFDQDLADQQEGLIIIDIGTVSTDIIIADGGDLWLRTLQIGGNNFTEALVRAFKLSFPKAEKLKREAATSKYARQIFQAMRPVFSDLVQEVQRSVGYYQSSNREAQLGKVYGVGSTFRLPGLQKFLKQQLQMDVIRPDGFTKISAQGAQAADFSDNAVNLLTAYGLAVQGLGLERIEANILPRQVLRQRFWKAKQPVFAAAAACMVLATAGAAARWWFDASTIDQPIDPSVQTALNKAAEYSAKWNEIANNNQDNPIQRVDNIRRMFDYRDLWPKLLTDISAAAASVVHGQADLLGGDYEKIRHIPRAKRRQLFIDTITPSYGGGVDNNGAGASSSSGYGGGGWDNSGGATVEDLGMGGGVDMGMGMGMGMGTGTGFTPGASSATPTDMAMPDMTAKDPKEPRCFRIKVSGWSPYSDAALLVDEMITWLQQNSELKDRPYKIVVVKRDMVVRPMNAPGLPPAPTATVDLEMQSLTTMQALFPQRPTKLDEPRPNDSVFEVWFLVYVVPPAQARLEMSVGVPTPAPAGPATAPAAQSPAGPGSDAVVQAPASPVVTETPR